MSVSVLLTGLPSAGKTTIAEALAARLVDEGRAVELLDGDVVRRDLFPELGYGKEDRAANLRRLGLLARMLNRHGVVVLVAAVSPYRTMREAFRSEVEAGGAHCLETWVDTPVDTCMQRDVKGLYRRALSGELAGFTGVDAPYEEPNEPDVVLTTATLTVPECVERLHAHLGT